MRDWEELRHVLMDVAKEYEVDIRGVGSDGMALGIHRQGVWLRIVASWGLDWDHVSVSVNHRYPTWEEMAWIAGIFFKDTETAMQIRPALDQYVNCHPYCLHWWRSQTQIIVWPPREFVGAVSPQEIIKP